MTDTERALIYWALRLVVAYHDDPTMNDTDELQQIVGWADQLEAETGVNVAYLADRYAQGGSDGQSPPRKMDS